MNVRCSACGGGADIYGNCWNGVLCDGTRTAPQAAHGNPGQAPNAGGGANAASHLAQYIAAQQTLCSQQALYNAYASQAGLNLLGVQGLGVGQLMQQNQNQLMVAQAQPYNPVEYEAALRAASVPLDHAGTTFGEFIGWRIWGLTQGYLTSYSADYAWLPGHPAGGDITDHGYGGIWAFKDPNRAFRKALESAASSSRSDGWVAGSVWMYGEVVEHEIGYRAQYAAVRSIEVVMPIDEKRNHGFGWKRWIESREMRRQSEAMRDELRERYGVIQDASAAASREAGEG